jgi:hypothetical protein
MCSRHKMTKSLNTVGGLGHFWRFARVAHTQPHFFLFCSILFYLFYTRTTTPAQLKITATNLARTLKANDLELVGDGESFKVVSKKL